MTTMTYTGPVAAPRSEAAGKPAGRGFWGRLFDALVAARMRQAEREIAYYRHLHEDLFDKEPSKVSYRNDAELPFVR
jgi:hypothetical protein